MNIRIPVSLTHFSILQAHVVNLDVPLLFGLYIMTKFKIILDFDEDIGKSKSDGWTLQMIKKLEHAYVELKPSIFFTETDLRRIHIHLYCPQKANFFAVVGPADPKLVSTKVYSDFEKLQTTCGVCKMESDKPHLFRVSLLCGDCMFNLVVSLGIIKLEIKTLLYAVYRDTKFSSVCFMNGESTTNKWEAFIRIWVSPLLDM